MKVIFIYYTMFICVFLNAQIGKTLNTDSLLTLAKAQLGTPYKYGTSRPGVSFDCSGFTSYVYGSFGITNCRVSNAYSNLGLPIELTAAQPGDCILFSGTSPSSKTVGHVGIVVQNDADGLKFIHCSSSKSHCGVVITDYYNSAYPRRFLGIRRLYNNLP